jgi:hypothetical protein
VSLYPPGAERWRLVVGAPDYLVSDQGRVQRITPGKGTNEGAFLTPSSTGKPNAGFRVTVQAGKGRKRGQSIRMISHLVLEAFVGPAPLNHRCSYLDGDYANAALTNLRWVPNTAPPPRRKLDEDAVRRILIEAPIRGAAALAREFGVSVQLIGRILRREIWKHVTVE